MPAPAGAAQAMYGKYLCTHLRQGYSLIPELGFVCWEVGGRSGSSLSLSYLASCGEVLLQLGMMVRGLTGRWC